MAFGNLKILNKFGKPKKSEILNDKDGNVLTRQSRQLQNRRVAAQVHNDEEKSRPKLNGWRGTWHSRR